MSRSTLNQRLAQIEGYSKALVQAVRVMDERKYILEPLLNDEEVKKSLEKIFQDNLGAHAYNHLVPLFAQDLARDLARLFLDPDNRSGSIINIYRKASEQNLHKALRTRFRSIPDKLSSNVTGLENLPEEYAKELLTQLQNSQRAEFEESFDAGWAKVSDTITALETDPVSKKLKTFRDKYHAHLEFSPMGESPAPFDVGSLELTYQSLFDFSDRYIGAAFELHRLVSGTVYDVDDFSEVHRENGSAMWRRLARLD